MSELKQTKPYGTWPSIITPELVAGSAIRYGGLCADGDDVYWLEGRPQEKGRSVLVRYRDGQRQDVLPKEYSVRSRVHEYGGGAFAVSQGDIWFVNDSDQQVYRYQNDTVIRMTDETGCRYADFVIDGLHQCVYAVREDNRDDSRHEPINDLVSIRMSDGDVSAIAQGDDFYAAPALSADQKKLAWISWRHPNMPWDETVLWLADIDDQGDIQNTRKVVAEDSQSVFQPAWSPDGQLYYVNDPDGWWRIYRINVGHPNAQSELVSDYPAEMGLPLWQFGMKTYAFQNEHRIIATICEQDLWRLVKICTNTGEVEPIDTSYNSFSAFDVSGGLVAMIASGFTCGDEVACIDIESNMKQVCSEVSDSAIDESWVSVAEPISFPTSDGDTAYGYYYAPKNPDYESDGRPPLLVMTHGGPTGSTSASLNFKTQYWTSRGFAILDVNYRGSTGYGRAYRDRLKGEWGIYDVDDVVAGAQYLVEQGLADPECLSIRGGSAGGFTTLAALTFRDKFKAGCSHYGIGELETLASDTHKFEARYLDTLVGKYPEEKDIYIERSPLHHVDQLSCPVIFMQGTEDKVVPPEQAEKMAAALEAKGIDVELLMFEGEQHGFRRAETIMQALEAELAFYTRVYHL